MNNKKFLSYTSSVFIASLLLAAPSIAFSNSAQSSDLSKTHYQQCPAAPLPIGKEDYQKNLLTLAGLDRLYIDFDFVEKIAKAKQVDLVEGLKATVINKLQTAGIRLISKEELKTVPGQPQLNLYPNFPGHLGSSKNGQSLVEYRPDCCRMGIWASFEQGGRTLRAPETNHKFNTWGKGQDTSNCSDPGDWMGKAILQSIDDFLKDRSKGEQEYAQYQKKKPVTAQKTIQAPQPVFRPLPATNSAECQVAVMTYVDMFKTNQTAINTQQFFVLDRLIATVNACPAYNYVIEAHADTRSSHTYNEKLSTLRAAAISQYLRAKGISPTRFIVQAFGEIRPITAGATEQDHAANRRVVVRPYRAF